jgi:hypothetical protein
MSHYIDKRGVPILDEHVLKDDEGGEILKVDKARLEEIARRNNKRISETGDLTPFVIGHTDDDAPEDEQPEIVGYATRFYVAPFRKTGRYALHADAKFMAGKKNLINKFPRRSVELWLDDWKIDPIALLGATTPERDLGLLQLGRGGRRKIRRYMNDAMPLNQPPVTQPQAPQAPDSTGNGDPQVAQIAQAVVDMLQSTDVWQFMEQQMQDASAPPPPMPGMGDPMMDGLDPMGGMPPMPPPGPGGFPGDEGDFDDEDDEDYDDEEEDEDDEEPVRMSAAAMPAGTNTFNPGSTNRRPMSRQGRPARYQRPATPGLPADLIDRLRSAAQSRRLQQVHYARQVAQQAAELRDLKIRYQRAERERDLIQLEAEGVLFDRVSELDFVTGMPDPMYQQHLARLKHNYKRAPIGRIPFSANDFRSATGGVSSPSTDRARKDDIVALATKKGISYAAAKAELEGGE